MTFFPSLFLCKVLEWLLYVKHCYCCVLNLYKIRTSTYCKSTLHFMCFRLMKPLSFLVREIYLFFVCVHAIGQCVQMACYLFLDRKWEKDRDEFRRKLYYFNAIGYPVQMLLFPEGGDFTTRTKAKSAKFADDNGLPHLQYCFYPRTTGFVYTINAMRDEGLDAVYDMTIAYPDMLPKDPNDVTSGVMPREVHYHIVKYNNEDVPQDKKGLEEWIMERWSEKEARLKEFYTHHEYREKDGSKPPEVKRPRDIIFLIRSIMILGSLNLLVLIPLWYFPLYFSIYLLTNGIFLTFHHRRGLGNLIMDSKNAEIEEAVRKSTRNKVF